MEESTSNSAPPPNGTNKSKLPQIDPFTSAESIVQSLQVQDAQLLQASLVQIDKRAAALNAKPAPRGSPDLLLDYLKKYPGCDGIFHAWDYANKTNNSPLSTAILSCLTSLIRLLSTDPFTPSPELIKTLLSAKYTPYLERALNPGRNDVTTSALRLCNVLVGFAGGRFAKKLFSAFGWSPKVTTRLYKTRLRSATSANVLNKPDIRTLLVLLVLSFLSAGDTRLKSQVLETKGLVSGIFKGLSEDPEVVTNLVLEIMFSEVVQDRRVGLEARRNVFDESCINELVKLYDYALPVISDDSPLPASHPTISVHRFFYALTDWLSEQIASSPVGRSSGPQKILSNLLKSLQVTEDQSHRTLALYILERSPVLSGQFWSKFPSSLDPRLSSRWISAITFATQVVALPISSNLELPSSSDSESGAIDPVTFAPPSVQSILDTILPPSPPSSQTLTRTWYTKALTHANPLVSFLSSIFLLSILQKASKVLEAMMKISQTLEEDGTKGGRWVESMRRIREEIKNKVPDVSLIVGLMSRTAAAAAATSSVAPVKSKDKGKDSVKTADATKANESAALLRTNIALRLLYLYHRVVPSLIATLKFDFTKLPQTFAIKSESTDSAEDGAGSIEGGEGLRAMSSSYALRLAAVHESGAASFSRPGDHFKSLLPLFTLYRVSSLTPSNRSLLLQTLKRQLSTPLLFGEGDEQLHEVEVWLDSLPVPIGDDDHDVDETIAWFEKIVQKTLTSPIKPKGSAAADSDEAGDEAGLSPLMKTALNALETAADQPSQSLQSFVQTLFINYLAHKTSIESSTTLYDSIKAAWRGHKDAVKGTLKTLADVLEVVKGGKEKKLEGGDAEARIEQLIEAGDEDKIGQVSQGFSPRKANVFVALDARPAALDAMLPRMPLPLLFLHARTTDLSKLLPLLHLHSSSPSLVPAAQIVLHRFVHAAAQDDRQSFAEALVALHVAADEQRKTAIRKRVAAKSGVYGLFETEGAKEETAQVIAQLLAGVLSAATSSDVDLVQPFASLLVSDLSATGITARVRGSTVLVPYFTDKSALAFASALVSRLPASLDTINQALLGAVLARLDTVPRSHEFDQFWIANLSTFVQASSSSNAVLQQAAEELLLKGSSIVSSTSTGSRAASTLPFVEWTEMILSLPIAFSRAQATVLSALISRSSAARARFLAYVQKKDASQFNQALEMPLKTLLEVAVVREEKIPLDESLVEAVVESVLARGEVAASSLSVVELLAAASPSAGTLVRSTLEKTLASTDRGKHKASTMALVGRLAEKDEELLGVLEAYVNGSFEGLTREFVDAKEDEQVATDLAGALASALVRHKVALKGHLVEPLVTAIATNRLNNSDAVNLAIAICKRHLFKDNEVTRHLNEIFASKAFHDYASNASTIAGASLSTVELVLALSAQSPSAAGNARSVERLVPFYRGTLSPLDQSLFALFRSIERSRSSSLSSLFAAWNPSMDSTTLLDGTRIGALGAVRKAFVRRSWLRAFASTRNVYTTEEDARTYDPRFLVAFTLALIEEDTLKPQEWTTLLESGVIGTVIAALAAADDGLRTMARATLALMHKKVEPLTFRERDEVVLLLAHCRNATFSPAGEPIPSTIALFFAHCAFQLGTPASPLYPAFTRFLLQRSTIDMRDVPMFYNMMYASKSDEWAAAPREERGWMIRFLTEGLVRTQDWKIYRRRQVFELVASLFQSSRPDAPLRRLILEFIIRATTIPTAARELLSRNGLVGWVAAQTPVDSTERRHLATILGNLCRVMTFDKLTGIADLLDALTAVIGADVTAIDATSLLTLLRYIISRLPVPAELSAPSPTYVLTLDRLSALLSSLASTLSTTVTAPVAESFYAATMSLAFVRFEAGLRETRRDGELWKLAIELGLQAGVEDLGKAVLQLQ